MRCGLQRLKTPDTIFSFSKKILYALFRRQHTCASSVLFPSTGQGALKAAALEHEGIEIYSGFNAPWPVPSFDLDDLFIALMASNGGAVLCAAINVHRPAGQQRQDV
jgi:hypothetical protein